MSVKIESEAEVERSKNLHEAQYLKDFLVSPGFLLTKEIVDAEIKEGTESLLQLPVVDIATLITHFQIIGEINANMQFEKRFRARLAELEAEIGPVNVD